MHVYYCSFAHVDVCTEADKEALITDYHQMQVHGRSLIVQEAHGPTPQTTRAEDEHLLKNATQRGLCSVLITANSILGDCA